MDKISFVINDGTVIRYTKGVSHFDYQVSSKKLAIDLDEDYVCEDKSKLREYNISCTPWHHAFYDVVCISMI